MRTHLRRQHSNYRMVHRSKQTGTHNSEVNSTGTEDVRGGAATLRPRHGMVTTRLLSAQQTARLRTWNVRSLRGLGKTQQLAMEMERHKVSVLAVTETHIPDSGQCEVERMEVVAVEEPPYPKSVDAVDEPLYPESTPTPWCLP